MRRNPTSNGRSTTPISRPVRSWLSLIFLLAFSQLRAQAPADIARLNQQLTPITALRAGSGFADLVPLAPVVAKARVVGLGECTHGSHEVFQLKHRLLKYLVTQQGFTTLALEVDYGWGEILNEYIQTGAGDSLTVPTVDLRLIKQPSNVSLSFYPRLPSLGRSVEEDGPYHPAPVAS